MSEPSPESMEKAREWRATQHTLHLHGAFVWPCVCALCSEMDASLALLLDSERAQAREAAEARVREVEETALAQSELDGKKLNAYAAQARELRAVVKTYEAAEPQLRGEVRELRAALEEEHWRFASTYAPGVNNHGSVCKLCALLARTEIPKQ